MSSYQFSKDVPLDGIRGGGENLVLGILAGLVAAILGALLWMWVAITFDLHLGIIAIAIGLMVGFVVRSAGRGTTMVFGIVGAVLTLASCVGGDFLVVIQRMATPQHDFFELLKTANVVQIVHTNFRHMDAIGYLIYGIAIFEGYKFSIRR